MVQHGLNEGNSFRAQSFQMSDHTMGLGSEDKVIRCLIDPFCYCRQGGKPVPQAVQFYRAISCRVIFEIFRLFQLCWVKAVRPLPWLVRIAGQSDSNQGHKKSMTRLRWKTKKELCRQTPQIADEEQDPHRHWMWNLAALLAPQQPTGYIQVDYNKGE